MVLVVLLSLLGFSWVSEAAQKFSQAHFSSVDCTGNVYLMSDSEINTCIQSGSDACYFWSVNGTKITYCEAVNISNPLDGSNCIPYSEWNRGCQVDGSESFYNEIVDTSKRTYSLKSGGFFTPGGYASMSTGTASVDYAAIDCTARNLSSGTIYQKYTCTSGTSLIRTVCEDQACTQNCQDDDAVSTDSSVTCALSLSATSGAVTFPSLTVILYSSLPFLLFLLL